MHRHRHIRETGEILLRHGYPRLEMAFLVLLTGLAGLIASFIMLRAGIDSMALRYPLAVGCAFLAFLFQLWLWLRLRHHWHRDLVDVTQLPGGGSGGAGEAAAKTVSGHGGAFDGGGASASFDVPGSDLLGSSVEAAASAEEAAIPLFALIGITAVALSMVLLAFSLVSTAPFLFAELLVDGAMSATLYRRLRHLPQRHWTQAAVRRTIVPFALSALFLAAVGFGMEWAVPGAHTVGEFLHLRGQ
jgi:FtsH-binding integral membrane protein